MTDIPQRVIVTGARSIVGDFLLPQLMEAGFVVTALSRRAMTSGDARVRWLQCDLDQLSGLNVFEDELKITGKNTGQVGGPVGVQVGGQVVRKVPGADVLIHLAPLRLLPAILPQAEKIGVKRIIGFSSTSRFTKVNSPHPDDQQLVRDLVSSEAQLQQFCESAGIDWVVIRPTLIFSPGKDKNLSLITRFIKRFHFFPLIGKGSGLRQPIHAKDVAASCLDMLDNPDAMGMAHTVAGPETITYRQMVERLFQDVNLKPRFVTVSPALLRLLFRCARILPRYRYLNTAMIDRMNQDLTSPQH